MLGGAAATVMVALPVVAGRARRAPARGAAEGGEGGMGGRGSGPCRWARRGVWGRFDVGSKAWWGLKRSVAVLFTRSQLGRILDVSTLT